MKARRTGIPTRRRPGDLRPSWGRIRGYIRAIAFFLGAIIATVAGGLLTWAGVAIEFAGSVLFGLFVLLVALALVVLAFPGVYKGATAMRRAGTPVPAGVVTFVSPVLWPVVPLVLSLIACAQIIVLLIRSRS